MAKLNVGEAFLQVVASFENVHRTIAAEVAKIKDIKLNVEIDPDTTGFREKVRTGISGIGSMDVPVNPDVDTTRADVQVGEFATRTRAKLEAAIKSIGDFRMTADASEVERKIADIRAQLVTLQNQRIGVDISAEEAMARIRELNAQLTALGARTVNPQVKVDVDAARANLRALMADGDSLIAKFSRADLGSTMFAGIGAAIPPLLTSIGQLSGALGLIPGIAAGVGTALGAVVVGSQGLGEAFKAQAAAEQAATAAAQSDAPAQQAVAAANQAAAAAGMQNVDALKQAVAQGAAHIASLQAQQAAGQNVTTELKAAEAAQKQNVAALKNAEAATTGNVGALGNYSTAQKEAKRAVAESEAAHRKAKEAADAYAATLTNLAPSAREFVSAIIQLKPAFTQLRLDVQQELFKGIGDKILEVANNALPTLRAGLSSMASAINIVVQRVLDFIGKQSSIQSWQNIFQNLSTAAGNLAGAIQPVLQIITDVTEVGSQLLPGLAKSFADAAQRAADFVSKAKDTGQLRQWIQTGIDAVRELWGAFKDVVAIIRDLTVSPGFGPNFLEALKAVTGGIRWIIENVPGATTAVKLFFDAWLFAKVVQGLTNMVKTIGEVTGAIKGGIDVLKAWITKNVEAGAAAEAAAARSKTAWVGAVKAIGLALAAVALDKILPEAPAGSSNPFDKARQELHDLATAVEDPMGALEDLGNELSHFGDHFDFQNSPIMNFFRGLPGFFSGIWQQVSGTASGLVEGIAAQLGALPTRISGLLSGIPGFFSGVWQSVAQGAQGAWDGIVGAAQGAWLGIQGVWAGVSGFFSGIWQGIVGAAQGAWQGIVGAAQGAWQGIQGVWAGVSGFFSGIWQSIVQGAQSAWQGIVGAAQGAWQGIQGAWSGVSGFFSGIWQSIVSTAQGAWNGLVSFVQGVGQRIVQIFQALPGQIASVGTAIVQGIGQAIQNGWNWLVQTVQNLAIQLFNAAKAALGIASPSRQFMWIGRNLVLGLSQGIEAAQRYAEQAMARLNEMLLTAGGGADIQRNVNVSTTISSDQDRYRTYRRYSRDERAWRELEEMLRRWRGDRGGGGSSRPPRVPTTIGTAQTQIRKTDVAFGTGAASYIRRVTVPLTDIVNPTVQTPPSSGGGRGGRSGGGRIYIDTNSAIVEEILRIVRNEVRRVGGDVQDALGPR